MVLLVAYNPKNHLPDLTFHLVSYSIFKYLSHASLR